MSLSAENIIKDQELFQHLLDDKSSSEVLINGSSDLWVECDGRLKKIDEQFSCQENLIKIVRNLIHAFGRSIDSKNPFCNISLSNGQRIHAVIHPVTDKGILISIRKPQQKIWRLRDLVDLGFMTEFQQNYLKEKIKHKKNIFICGGTSSGKTTLLSALVNEVSEFERILALEDVREIRTEHPHFISLESRAANQEGIGEISLDRLLVEALRMRPDRILLGECRNQEALSLLFALNTGHNGSMATIHANSPREAIGRLEALALSSRSNLSEGLVQKFICGCVDLVIHLEKLHGRRSVQSIVEIKGYEEKNYLLKNVLNC
ncbi:MAG: Flp pilus assembly complex ATPase component TadA [Oligoflexia bacterium]|nr:Flp pilus assembly complex ATPase component TadA [Oligoflexia bacterium]